MSINPPYLLGHLPHSPLSTPALHFTHVRKLYSHNPSPRALPCLPHRCGPPLPGGGCAGLTRPGGWDGGMRQGPPGPGCAVPAGSRTERHRSHLPQGPSPPELNTSRGHINGPSVGALGPGQDSAPRIPPLPAPSPGQPPRPRAAPGANAGRVPAGWKPSFVPEQRRGPGEAEGPNWGSEGGKEESGCGSAATATAAYVTRLREVVTWGDTYESKEVKVSKLRDHCPRVAPASSLMPEEQGEKRRAPSCNSTEA